MTNSDLLTLTSTERDIILGESDPIERERLWKSMRRTLMGHRMPENAPDENPWLPVEMRLPDSPVFRKLGVRS